MSESREILPLVEKISKIRQAVGNPNQKQFGEMLNVDQSQAGRYLKGEAEPGGLTCLILAGLSAPEDTQFWLEKSGLGAYLGPIAKAVSRPISTDTQDFLEIKRRGWNSLLLQILDSGSDHQIEATETVLQALALCATSTVTLGTERNENSDSKSSTIRNVRGGLREGSGDSEEDERSVATAAARARDAVKRAQDGEDGIEETKKPGTQRSTGRRKR